MFFVRVMFYFSVLLRSKWMLRLLDSQLRLYFQVTQPEGALSVEFWVEMRQSRTEMFILGVFHTPLSSHQETVRRRQVKKTSVCFTAPKDDANTEQCVDLNNARDYTHSHKVYVFLWSHCGGLFLKNDWLGLHLQAFYKYFI